MDAAMDIKVEHQITQPESQLAVMETCSEEPALGETYMTEGVKMRLQAQKQGQQHQGSQSQFQKHQYVGQNFQGNQTYNKSVYGSGYKSQYNKGNNQGYGNKSPYQGPQQPVPSQAPVQQLRTDFGMILPTKFGLEQFLEMTKVLKHIEDKYTKPHHNQYNRHEPSKHGANTNEENQQPDGLMQSTIQMSQHSQITRNTQIGNISVEQMAMSLGSDPDHLVEALEEVFCVPQPTEEQDTLEQVRSDTTDVSILATHSTKNPVTILHVIFNLSSDAHIYIPKGTVVACPDGNKPEVDVIEVTETIEEAQETMQYRNHLLSRPWLPVPPKSDMICSPAEVKYHKRVELKDHNASADTKKHFEELCSQFPKVFSTNNEDIGHTNLITMGIDTSDNPPSAKKPYTLPLKHYDWAQQENESLDRAGIITWSVSPWASLVIIVPKKSAPGEPLRRRMCIDYCAVNVLQPKVVKADSKAKGNLTLHPLPNIDQLYAQLRGAKVFTTLNLRSGYYHIELGKDS